MGDKPTFGEEVAGVLLWVALMAIITGVGGVLVVVCYFGGLWVP